MRNWVKVTDDEFKVGIEIATLKKGELQIKYAKDIVAKDKEIQRLNNQLGFIKDQNKYIDKLEKMVKEKNSIIKEVREYIDNDVEVYYVLDTRLNKAFDKTKKVKKDLLQILDKVGETDDK